MKIEKELNYGINVAAEGLNLSDIEETLYGIVPPLSDEQVECLLAFCVQKNALRLSIFDDPYEFCERMGSRGNDDDGEVVFGKVQFAKSLMRKCYVGILEKPGEPAAVAVYNDDYCELYIYAPEEKGMVS